MTASETYFLHHHGGLAGDAHHVDDGAAQVGRQLHHHLPQLAVPNLLDLLSIVMQQIQIRMQIQIQIQTQYISECQYRFK